MNLIDIPSLIKMADELQPLPGSVVKLITLLSGGENDVDEITRVIRFDPTLTVRLLRMANSAFSGASVTITTVHEAVSRLGTQRVLSLAVAAHTRPLLRVQVTAYGYREGELWRHSVLAMLAAESAPRVCKVPVPGASSTAALLHDIGKLVMAHFLDPEILELLGRAQNEGGLGPMEAETQILQVHHGELGGLIARHWKLPDSIVNGITFHHNPEFGGDPVCDVVHVANVVAKHAQAKLLGKEVSATVNPDAAERLGIPEKDLDWLRDETVTSFTKVGGLFGAA
jgi:putative nucleotidyltransferase with HDIG domain